MNASPEQRAPAAGAVVPPPLLVLAVMTAGWLIQFLAPLRLPRTGWLTAAAVAFAAATFALIGAAGLALRTSRTPIEPWAPSTALVTGSIYSRSRNPIYLGFLMAQTAFALWTGFGWWLVLLPVSWYLLDVVQVRREERYLVRTFGDKYVDYTRRVRRWL